jgi:hypothetical protein
MYQPTTLTKNSREEDSQTAAYTYKEIMAAVAADVHYLPYVEKTAKDSVCRHFGAMDLHFSIFSRVLD